MRGLKRAFDIIVAGVGLMLTAPIVFVAGTLIKIESAGPLIFKQERTGRNGAMFILYKVRTMDVDPSAFDRPDRGNDRKRTLRTGAFLRKFKIDEFPQFWNVLKGDMSIVGPRPTVVEDTEKYGEHERIRLNVRPGLTGLAQINGGVHISWAERIEYDIYYVNNWSPRLEAYILWKTLLTIVVGDRRYIHHTKHLLSYSSPETLRQNTRQGG